MKYRIDSCHAGDIGENDFAPRRLGGLHLSATRANIASIDASASSSNSSATGAVRFGNSTSGGTSGGMIWLIGGLVAVAIIGAVLFYSLKKK